MVFNHFEQYWLDVGDTASDGSVLVERKSTSSGSIVLWKTANREDPAFVIDREISSPTGGYDFTRHELFPKGFNSESHAFHKLQLFPNDEFSLELHREYSRSMVHRLLAPEGSNFKPQVGDWGLWGIIRLKESVSGFVLFVTFGQKQAHHQFDEEIDDQGVLTWQSQPAQTTSTPQILDLISHESRQEPVHLFLRTNDRLQYTYFGELEYIDHDPSSSRPVWFRWQLVEGIPSEDLCDLVALQVKHGVTGTGTAGLVEAEIPPRSTPKKPGRSFAGRTGIDFGSRDAKNRKIGEAGELLVLEREKQKLVEAGRPDLAKKVRHISKEVGDGAGYDILSYDTDGSKLFIEVKSTTGKRSAPFFLTRRELEFAEGNKKHFRLARVYQLSNDGGSGRVWTFSGNLKAEFTLTPTDYKVVR